MDEQQKEKNIDKINQETVSDTNSTSTMKEQEETEVLSNLPPEVKRVVEIGMSMQRISGQALNPLLSKITEKHIDKLLDLSEQQEKNSYLDSQSSRKFELVYILIFVFLFIFLTIFLVNNNKELYLDLLKIIGAFAGGFGGGYGYKSYKEKKVKL